MCEVSVIRDTIDTGIKLGLFGDRKDGSYSCIFKSKLRKININEFRNMGNFNPERLQKSGSKAYPISNRPRGDRDLKSVRFHRMQIRKGRSIEPIWIYRKGGENILLDGVHRVVACYIERVKRIPCYIVGV
jgi:hypothetical protein